MTTRHEQLEQRAALISTITSVAQEIGFKGRAVYGECSRLAMALDKRGIKKPDKDPWRGGKWFKERGEDRGASVRAFVQQYIPDLWKRGVKRVRGPKCHCSTCALRRQAVCEREKILAAPVIRADVTHVTHAAVTHTNVTHDDRELPTDLGGWTLCHDRRGIYKAVRRVNGKLKSIYIGRDPNQAAAKIAAWVGRQDPSGDAARKRKRS